MDGRSAPLRERIDYLDAARGLACFLMVFVNFVAQYSAIPAWTKHAPGDGFTYVDGIAPLFVFIMGISGALSFGRRRDAGGLRRTVLHVFRRYGVLFVFGTIGTVILYAADGTAEWNIFQTLAVAGIVSLPFLFIKPPWARIAAALVLTALYQLALSLALARAVFQSPGPLLPSFVQSLALTTVAIYGSGVADSVRRGHTGAAAGLTCVIFTGLGLGLRGLVPLSRSMGSVTYLFFGLGMAAGALFACYFMARWFTVKRFPLLSTLGRNALVIFMVAAVLTKVLNALLLDGIPVLAALAVAFLLEAFCFGVATLLDHKGTYVKL